MIEKLDSETTYQQTDPEGMRHQIADLPRQCSTAWEMAQEAALPQAYRDARQIVILGMGGSAIGGALLAGLVSDECSLPILPVGGYDLPAHVGADSLVVVSSHSGNTEETLSTFAQAEERGCRIVAVTTGGRVAELAGQKGYPILRFPKESPPRAALGFSFTLLLGLLHRAGFLRDYREDVAEAVEVMDALRVSLAPEVDLADNPAKQMATRLAGRFPVVYGAGFLSPVARRWKGQFNENSKNWAAWEEMPELNHNAVVGYGLPQEARRVITVVMLRSALDHHRVQLRWEATRGLLDEAGVACETAWGEGKSRLAQMFSLIHFGDYVSLYLAMLNGADPSPVPPITILKKRLALG